MSAICFLLQKDIICDILESCYYNMCIHTHTPRPKPSMWSKVKSSQQTSISIKSPAYTYSRDIRNVKYKRETLLWRHIRALYPSATVTEHNLQHTIHMVWICVLLFVQLHFSFTHFSLLFSTSSTSSGYSESCKKKVPKTVRWGVVRGWMYVCMCMPLMKRLIICEMK